MAAVGDRADEAVARAQQPLALVVREPRAQAAAPILRQQPRQLFVLRRRPREQPDVAVAAALVERGARPFRRRPRGRRGGIVADARRRARRAMVGIRPEDSLSTPTQSTYRSRSATQAWWSSRSSAARVPVDEVADGGERVATARLHRQLQRAVLLEHHRHRRDRHAVGRSACSAGRTSARCSTAAAATAARRPAASPRAPAAPCRSPASRPGAARPRAGPRRPSSCAPLYFVSGRCEPQSHREEAVRAVAVRPGPDRARPRRSAAPRGRGRPRPPRSRSRSAGGRAGTPRRRLRIRGARTCRPRRRAAPPGSSAGATTDSMRSCCAASVSRSPARGGRAPPDGGAARRARCTGRRAGCGDSGASDRRAAWSGRPRRSVAPVRPSRRSVARAAASLAAATSSASTRARSPASASRCAVLPPLPAQASRIRSPARRAAQLGDELRAGVGDREQPVAPGLRRRGRVEPPRVERVRRDLRRASAAPPAAPPPAAPRSASRVTRPVFARSVTGAASAMLAANASASAAGSSASSSAASQAGKPGGGDQVAGRIGGGVGERRLAVAPQPAQQRVREPRHAAARDHACTRRPRRRRPRRPERDPGTGSGTRRRAAR